MSLTRSQAAKLLHVHPDTLLTWEQQGQLGFAVARTVGGHRRYDASDVEHLREQLAGQSPLQSGAAYDVDAVLMRLQRAAQSVRPQVHDYFVRVLLIHMLLAAAILAVGALLALAAWLLSPIAGLCVLGAALGVACLPLGRAAPARDDPPRPRPPRGCRPHGAGAAAGRRGRRRGLTARVGGGIPARRRAACGPVPGRDQDPVMGHD